MKDNKGTREEIKLLLLGPGESGKSTIFKQMKIIQENGGYTRDELMEYKFVIQGNCITQMKVLINAAQKLRISLQNPSNEERMERIKKIPTTGEAWSREVGQDIKALWGDQGIQQTYALRDTHYQINDSANYFFDNIDRFLPEDYCPSEQDVLRCRVRTTGIDEARFTFARTSFRMMDVGGQRTERRKWIHCFEHVTTVIFCTSLSEYDQTLREDSTQNRMKESLLLFDEICNSSWFQNTAFVLFLNKTDLFKEKLKIKNITNVFPEYTGGQTFENATSYIQDRFVSLNRTPHSIYTHLTCAVDTDNIILIFNAVRETILNKVLNTIFM